MAQTHTLITIGRQFGSGGREIAFELGKKLGIPVYDSELLTKAAEESGFSKDLFLQSDEKRSLFLMGAFSHSNQLFQIQSEVIHNIAEKGPGIFVGRCSDYVLRDMETLNVFVTAPIEKRVERVGRRENIAADKLEDFILKNDRTRETYYNYCSFRHWGQADNYDLCIDSSILGCEGTADMIIEFAKRKGIL